MQKLAHESNVDIILAQEHNLHPCRDAELKRIALERGFVLSIAYAPAAPDGVHRGGTLILTKMSTVEWPIDSAGMRVPCVLHSEPGALVVQVEWRGRTLKVGSVYVPCQPYARIEFLLHMEGWISEDMFLGGDWNCVPDVTLDVQSSSQHDGKHRTLGL